MRTTIFTIVLAAASAMGALASPPWQDQRINAIGREPMGAHMLPFVTEKAAEANRALPASRRYINGRILFGYFKKRTWMLKVLLPI